MKSSTNVRNRHLFVWYQRSSAAVAMVAYSDQGVKFSLHLALCAGKCDGCYCGMVGPCLLFISS